VTLGKKHILIGLAAAIGIYLAASAIYNSFLSEEQKIKNVFHQMASDVENKEVLGFGGYFTREASIRYRDFGMSPREIGPFLWRLLQSYEGLEVTFSELSVEINGEQAAVIFAGKAVDTKQRTKGEFEGSAKLRKVEGEWKIHDAAGREHRRPTLRF